MSNRVVSRPELRRSALAVEQRFLLDCRQRQLNAPLPEGMYASGQFFDEPQRRQRGLHGTAAALMVLGSAARRGSHEARDIASGLVAYLLDREAVEMRLAAEINDSRGEPESAKGFDIVAYWNDKLRHDRVNTSKQAELLYSLSFVQAGTADITALHNAAFEGLMKGRSHDGLGWGLVLDAEQASDEVATAYVVRAMHVHGHKVAEPSSWLREHLVENLAVLAPPRGTLEIDCLLLSVLVEADLIDPAEARLIFDRLWRHLEPRLADLDAKKVPFDDQPKNHFLLLHWQLHLVGLAAVLRPVRRYLAPTAQRCLRLHIDAVDRGESLAPAHDVDRASTRNYAYFHHLINSTLIDRSTPGWLDAPAGVVADVAGVALKWIRRFAWAVLATITVALLGGVLVSAMRDGFTLSELAPEVLGAGLLGLLAYLARRGRCSQPPPPS